MALNPEISLGVRPPVIQPLQIQNPLEQYAKVQSLRNLMTQGQIGQMNLEQTQLENEAKQRQAQDEQSLGSWMRQNQQRPDLTPQEIVAAHPNPAGIKLATAWSAQQTAALAQRKAVLDAAHEEAKTDDRLYNSVTDDQTKATVLAELVRLKRIDGTQASHLLSIPFDSPEFKSIQQSATAQSLDRLQRIEAEKNGIALRIAQNTEGAVTQGAIADSSKKRTDDEQARVAFDAAKLAAAFDQSAETGAAALAALDPARAAPFLNATTAAQIRQIGLTPHEQITAQQAAANAARQSIPNTPTELSVWMNDPKRTPEEKASGRAAMRDLELHAIASRPVINNMLPGLPTVGAGGLNQTTGEEFLKTLPPGLAAEIRGMASGGITAPSANSRAPGAAQKRDALLRFDPTWTEQRAQIRKSFTTGPDGRNIGALNTAIVHLGRLGNAAESLENGSFVPGNEAYNWLRDKFGSDKVTNFGLLKDAVAGEMAAALKGNATDIEIEKMGKSIRAANSPGQMRGVVQEGMSILNDKANTYSERYHQFLPDDPWSPILPSAREQLARHSGGAGSVDPKLKSYADQYFGGDITKAQAAIAEQRKRK